MSKVFSFSPDYEYPVIGQNVIKRGSGYAIYLEDGKEVYDKSLDENLPDEIEHIYPDYGLYGIEDHAYGFLTRGCVRSCAFCHVCEKEGRISRKVADLSEFWNGQSQITLCDPNILACKDWKDLLGQLAESKAYVEFNQGLDVRLATEEKIEALNKIRIKTHQHLAWDNPKQDLTKHFERWHKLYKRHTGTVVYVLVNYDSTIEEDLYRIYTLRDLKFDPYVMIYDKEHCDPIYKKMQRWVNNRFVWRKCERFEDYKR